MSVWEQSLIVTDNQIRLKTEQKMSVNSSSLGKNPTNSLVHDMI